MQSISFTCNWNNKLACDAFTTIRLFQPRKYVVGQSYNILLKGRHLADAVIVDIRRFLLDDLSNFVAYLDTGYSKENCTGIIRKMYPTVDFNTTNLSLILLHKTKPTHITPPP